jgi:tRNA A-37 threonylcarbamoyl transferase component Bud32
MASKLARLLARVRMGSGEQGAGGEGDRLDAARRHGEPGSERGGEAKTMGAAGPVMTDAGSGHFDRTAGVGGALMSPRRFATDAAISEVVQRIVKRTSPLREEDPETIGDFPLLARLDQGEQAEVYLGTSGQTELVAVKVLRRERRDDLNAQNAFDTEVEVLQRASASLSPRFYAEGWDHERRYLVSEYLPGDSLHEMIEKGGPLTGAELRRVAVEISRTVAELHRLGIEHRDLKPRHAFNGAGGRLLLIDFGVAEYSTELARTGRRHRDESAPRDGYGLGALIFFAAYGELPYQGSDAVETALRFREGKADVRRLPGPWREVILNCLQSDPRQCPSAADVLRVVEGS